MLKTRLIFAGMLAVFGCASAWAGGGAEGVFLVANSADRDSLAIANHYAEWRKVPEVCQFHIDWPNAPKRSDVFTFRERILEPILAEIKRRKLGKQIHYIVYSSGFPYAIDFSGDLGDPTEKYAVGSLTSLTYLYESVLAKEASYRLDLSGRVKSRLNSYARSALPGVTDAPSRGFNALQAIHPNGRRGEQGPRYYLSTMLGYTRGQVDNSVAEVLTYLFQAVQADGSRPEGTIYFVRNPDVRSSTRHDLFAEVVAKIEAEGVKAEVIQGKANVVDCLPVKRTDVMGAMVGHVKFSWLQSQSKIRPGAICENLTSTGGMLDSGGQTLLCEFLRFGAAASSGTVVEPYSVLAKFPHPVMQLHYVRGCSVAEAYYQSVLAPYQLIIVGDPLCQPWAMAPQVEIKGLDSEAWLSGVMQFSVNVESQRGADIKSLEVFVDGVLAGQAELGEPIVCDTTKLRDGHHELRIVATEDTDIETQGRAITSFRCSNHQNEPSLLEVSMIPKSQRLRLGSRGYVQIQYPDAREVRLYRGRELVGKATGEKGRIRILADDLGSGSVNLIPVAIPSQRSARAVFGAPLKVQVRIGVTNP